MSRTEQNIACADAALSEIDAAVAKLTNYRQISWFDRLPVDAANTFMSAKKKFHAGGYGKTPKLTLARVLAKYATDKGLSTCGYKGIAEWLRKN